MFAEWDKQCVQARQHDWALWEREQGNLELCIALQRRGLQFNPTDAALYSVRICSLLDEN
eukprot:scaffold14466_cov21-Tisochrysis_lutea.AAC.1